MIINKLAKINKLIVIGQNGRKIKTNVDREFLYSLPGDAKVISLSFDQLVYLIRGVAMLELDQSKYQFGSTTIINNLLRTLKLRRSEKREQDITDLTNWLLSHRVNPYIPFGSSIPLDVKSIYDYDEYKIAKIKHREEKENANKLRAVEAKKRRQANILKHQKIADKKNKEREVTINMLKNAPINVRLRYIISFKNPVNYFPEGWARFGITEFKKLPKNLIKKLYIKLGYAKRGSEWFRLKKVVALHLDKNKSRSKS